MKTCATKKITGAVACTGDGMQKNKSITFSDWKTRPRR